MKNNKLQSKSGGLTSLLLGPILVLSIALATINMMSTYKGVHQQKQATLWNIIQLDREIGNTLFNASEFINGQISTTRLRQYYETLQNSFPKTLSSISKDKIFQQVSGLSNSINTTFNHVQSAEQMIQGGATVNITQLNQWLNQLNGLNKKINQEVLDNVASTQSEYSSKAFKTIIKTAAILLFLIFTFIIYLGYLLNSLRKERKRNLYMLAHDPLTGLSSRECVMTTLQSRCNNKTPFAVMMFDLNKFKAVNDTFGHHAGDQLLIHLAQKFQQTLCKFGIVGRMGGDEFIWIAESDNPTVIEQQYALLLNELKTPCIINKKRLYIHISAGGGIAEDHKFHITELLERTDEAMYQAKSQQIKEICWSGETHSHKPYKKPQRPNIVAEAYSG